MQRALNITDNTTQQHPGINPDAIFEPDSLGHGDSANVKRCIYGSMSTYFPSPFSLCVLAPLAIEKEFRCNSALAVCYHGCYWCYQVNGTPPHTASRRNMPPGRTHTKKNRTRRTFLTKFDVRIRHGFPDKVLLTASPTLKWHYLTKKKASKGLFSRAYPLDIPEYPPG